MLLMRLKLIEHVQLKKVPNTKLFSSGKVWGGFTPYEFLAEMTPFDTNKKNSKAVYRCNLSLASDETTDEITYWYVMRKHKRREADATLKEFILDLKVKRWGVAEAANKTKTLFDDQKRYWVRSASHETGQDTKETVEGILKKILLDIIIQKEI